MNSARPLQITLRRLVAALLLLSALLPIQQVFACDMMGGVTMADCCCHEKMAKDDCGSGACEHDAQIPLGENGCCEVSLSESSIHTSQQSVNHAIGVSELVEPPLPPPAPAYTLLQAVHPSSTTALIDHHSPIAADQTYLLTQRLRI